VVTGMVTAHHESGVDLPCPPRESRPDRSWAVRVVLIALLLAGLSLAATSARADEPTDSVLAYSCDSPFQHSAANCTIWHTDPVSITWMVLDPNYAPVPGTECDTTLVDQDTPGMEVTCAVEDAALTHVQKTVTLRVDRTPPAVTGAAPGRPPDFGDWWNHSVDLTFAGTDATSGIDHCDTVTYAGPDGPAGVATGACTDVAGNATSGTAAIKYDATPPTITSVTPERPPDHDGWWNHPVGIAFAGADATSGLAGCDNVAYSGPDNPSADVTGGCWDSAGNIASAHFGIKYDAQPPTVEALPPEIGSNEVVLHWTASRDAVLTEVSRSPGIGGSSASTIYSGNGDTFADPGVKNDVTYTYSITASDAAANAASATVTLTPRAASTPQPDAAPLRVPDSGQGAPNSPRRGSRTKKRLQAPLLQWRPVKNARYYNVQLYRGNNKILSTWPDSARLQLPLRWRFHGRLMRLTPARYHWYVWPGFGARSLARYGGLIVHRKFTFRPSDTAARNPIFLDTELREVSLLKQVG
jgi:hypothetical protein